MLLSVFFALMVGSPTHPPLLALDLLPHPPHRPVPCPHPPPPSGSLNAPSACASVQSALPLPLCKHCLLEAACLAAHALPPGRGMDLNPEMLSAIDRMCVGLVVQCMYQCRVHNLNPTLTLTPTPTLSLLLTLHLTLPMTLTLTLIKTEYWDRAGGGGNMSYDW